MRKETSHKEYCSPRQTACDLSAPTYIYEKIVYCVYCLLTDIRRRNQVREDLTIIASQLLQFCARWGGQHEFKAFWGTHAFRHHALFHPGFISHAFSASNSAKSNLHACQEGMRCVIGSIKFRRSQRFTLVSPWNRLETCSHTMCERLRNL